MIDTVQREIVEIQCKSLLNRVVSEKMPFRWSINPYRGCEHKCVYCYARRYHAYFDLGPGLDFERKIFVKVNAPKILRQELSKKSWQRESVAIGTAVDPYQPVEGKYKLTREILQVLLDYWTPCSVVTKNTMVLRDAELLAALSQGPGCRVWLSITTLDEALARRLEPDTPSPRKRLEILRELAKRGVHAGVMIAPVLPGLTDGPELESLVEEAIRHGATSVYWGVLRLDEGVKELYFDFVARHAPSLLRMYQRMYEGVYAPGEYARRIDSRLTGALSLHRPPRFQAAEATSMGTDELARTALPLGAACGQPAFQIQLGI